MRRREETSASRARTAARRGRLPPTLPLWTGSGTSPNRCRPSWWSYYFLAFLLFLATRITPLSDPDNDLVNDMLTC